MRTTLLLLAWLWCVPIGVAYALDNPMAALLADVSIDLQYDRCEDALNQITDFEHSLPLSAPTPNEVLVYKAQALSCLASYEAANQIWSHLIVSASPKQPQYYAQRAQNYAYMQAWDKAYLDCASLLALKVDSALYCKPCAYYAQNAKHHKEARQWFATYLAKHPYDSEALYLFAQVLLADGQINNVLTTLNKAIELNPSMMQYYLFRASVYRQSELYSFAVADYRHYLKQNPTDNPTLMELADLLLSQQKKKEGCECLRQAKDNGYVPARKRWNRLCH